MAGVAGLEPMINFLDQNLLSQRLFLLKLAGVAGLKPMINFLDQNLLSQRLLLLKLAGVAGLEPTNDGIKTRCLTTWLYPI